MRPDSCEPTAPCCSHPSGSSSPLACDGTWNGTDDNRGCEGRCCQWMNKWCSCRRYCLSDWDQWCPGRAISFFGELWCQNLGRGGDCQVCGVGGVGRAGRRLVGPRVGAAGRAALVPCRPRFWVRGGGLGGRECGAHRGAGSRCGLGHPVCRWVGAVGGVVSSLPAVPAGHSYCGGVTSVRGVAPRVVTKWWSPFVF